MRQAGGPIPWGRLLIAPAAAVAATIIFDLPILKEAFAPRSPSRAWPSDVRLATSGAAAFGTAPTLTRPCEAKLEFHRARTTVGRSVE